MPAACPAAAIPFWHRGSVVAAAVEVGTVPLAQVDTFVLWKRAGAAGCWHVHVAKAAGPRRGPQQVPWGGFGAPWRSGEVQGHGTAHRHGTSQGRRHSQAEHAWAGLVQS